MTLRQIEAYTDKAAKDVEYLINIGANRELVELYAMLAESCIKNMRKQFILEEHRCDKGHVFTKVEDIKILEEFGCLACDHMQHEYHELMCDLYSGEKNDD